MKRAKVGASATTGIMRENKAILSAARCATHNGRQATARSTVR
jgi:hypothetical protein